MDQYNPFVIRYHRNHGGKILFYTYNNVLYALPFPEEWAKDFKPETGPANCSDCGTFGVWNAAFLGYCVKCAEKYNGERGNGFIFYGTEKKINKENKNSAFNTYLKDVDLDEIGDTELCDTAALMDEIQSYEPGHQFCQQEDDEDEDEEEEKVEWSIDRDADSICIFGINFDGGDDSN